MSLAVGLSMTNPGNQSQRDAVSHSKAIDVLCVVILVAYFLHFAFPALGGGFVEDEIVQIWTHWSPGASTSLWANICFWKGMGRPGGAVYYLLLYHFFGLNPEPYRIAQISILAALIPITYYLARLLTSSRSIAFLAVLAFCYHGQLANLVFSGAFSYDVGCSFFYFAALTYYIHVREKGLLLRPMQWVGFLALYVCALNVKEMGVTLPVIVLIYELLKYPGAVEPPKFSRWVLRAASPALVAGVITAIYCYNKIYGSGYVGNFSAQVVDYRTKATGLDRGIAALLEFYTPRYSWQRFIESNARYVSELFYLVPKHALSGEMLLAIWALLFVYAFLRRDCVLKLMAFWVVITPLPLAFIFPRGGGRLDIPLFGWAMIFAKLAWDAITVICRCPALLRRNLGWEPRLQQSSGDVAADRARWAPVTAAGRAMMGKISPVTFRVFAMVVVAFGVAVFTQWENQRSGRIRGVSNSEQKAVHVAQALRSLNLKPAPRSMILLKPEKEFYQSRYYPEYFASMAQDNPLRQVILENAPRYWYYVASLVWGNHTLQIHVEDQERFTDDQIAKMDYIISFNEFQAKLIAGPPPG
jgi:hypothetical protein